MPKDRFRVGGWSTESDVSLEVEKIRGVGGLEYPRLSFSLEFILNPSESKEGIRAFSLLWLKSSLYLRNRIIGEGISESMAVYSWPHPSPQQILIEVPLDAYRIEKIEEIRQGDVEFRLSGSALVAEHPRIKRAAPNESQEYRKNVEEFRTGKFDITFTIPQSNWIDKILPGLGYGKIKLIEVPIPEKIIPGIFKKALEEIQQSQRYFLEGNYDKVVAHCRNAVQLIPEALPISLSGEDKPAFNNKVKIFLKEHLSPFLSDTKREFLEKMIKATWNLSSLAHHPVCPGYFNRADAEAVLQITTTLLAYVGKLLEQKEKNVSR